jgi:alcohol dehydrogenase
MPPYVAVNTTAARFEMTPSCIITDSSRKVKMAIVTGASPPASPWTTRSHDRHAPALTAATVWCLTHAVRPRLQHRQPHDRRPCAEKSIKLIFRPAPAVPTQGHEAREGMCFAILAGMAFNNAILATSTPCPPVGRLL